MKIDSEILNMIFRLVFTVVGVIITNYLIPYIKTSVYAEKWAEVMDFCKKCVQAAEKKYTPEEWEKKKTYVMTLVAEKVSEIGISISISELDALVEGFVKEIKG